MARLKKKRKILRLIKELYLWMAYGEILSLANPKKYFRIYRHGFKAVEKDFDMFVKSLE